MRKRIVGLGAAAVMVAGGAKGDTRDWVKRESAGAEATMKQLPILLQGTIVAKKFANANTVEQFKTAEATWITLRPNLAKYEMSLSCKDYGASHDKDIAIDVVGELLKKPLGLLIDVSKFVLSVAGQEKDEALEALKDATKELVTLAKDKGVEKALENVAARGKIELHPVLLTPA
jgi:hypothetical protein